MKSVELLARYNDLNLGAAEGFDVAVSQSGSILYLIIIVH